MRETNEQQDRSITYPLYVHLAIAGAITLGFAVGWFVLPAVERWAVSR